MDADRRRGQPKRKMRKNPKIIALAAALLFLVGAGTAVALYWTWAAEQLVTGVDRWRGEQEARGYRIAYEGPQLDGFPAALHARFTGPSIEAPGAWRWSGPNLDGNAKLLSPLNIRLSFPGAHRFEALYGEESLAVELAALAADAQVWLLTSGRLEAAETELRDVRVSGAVPLVLERLWARLEALERKSRQDLQAFELALESGAVDLPAGMGGPFGDKVDAIRLKATLIGEIPSGSAKDALARWRETGGSLEIQDGMLSWGPLVIEASGALTLDEELRPQGKLQARVSGLPEIADLLQQGGAIEPDAAAGIKIMAAVLGGQKGGPGAQLPITLRRGRLYLGPAKVLRFGPIL